MVEPVSSDPVVQVAGIQELARDLVVIPNGNVQLVPNIGVIGGRDAVLVVDTGMGPSNAEVVLKFAEEYARGRKLYLTTTHFHPEHAFGAQTFAGEATFLINQAQADDLKTKGPGYLEMFRGSAPRSRTGWRVLSWRSPTSSTTRRMTWTWAVAWCSCGRPAVRTAGATRW